MRQPISDERFRALMIAANAAVEDAAVDTLERVLANGGDPLYPPNGGLTDEERSALPTGSLTPIQRDAFRKVLAGAAAGAIFRLFGVIDAVGDPEGYDGLWLPIHLCETEEEEDADQGMLHDTFFEAYWDWRSQRGDRGWTLDLAP
jgi:hypothetical protein